MFLISKIKRQSNEYGVSWWMVPDFLLLISGVINIAIMIVSYWWLSDKAEDPREAVPFVAIEAVLIMLVGNLVTESARRVMNVNHLKKEFTDIVTHHLRSPLASIKWYMEMLLKSGKGNLSKKQLEYISVIIDSDRKLLNLINDLLNMTNLEKEKAEYVIERINVLELVEESVRSFMIFAKTRGIHLAMRKGRKKTIWLMADRVKFRVVVDNLLNNAIRYTPKGGTVTVSAVTRKGILKLSVQDTGIGIREKDKANIFEKFYRSRDAKAVETQGTGLGLYICSVLLKGMDGDIAFQSQFGKGSTFSVTIPCLGSGS